VIAQFARSELTAHQLELAAMLARTMADLNRERWALRKEGSVVTTEKGTRSSIRVRPWYRCRLVLSYRSGALCLYTRAQDGEARDGAKRRAGAKEIEADNPLDDRLIARPN
jgi:hypothetical protein